VETNNGTKVVNGVIYEARDVLAGAYRGKDIAARALLTHWLAEGAEKSLCKRIADESLCDIGGPEVTCPECARRMAVLVNKAAKAAA
jgi:hypothetical protein